MDTMITKAVNNPDFAKRVGIHFTMASRLRNGERMPSTAVLSRIVSAFELTGEDLEAFMRAARDRRTLGMWIDANLFEQAREDPTT
jgi:transcriptional regulator with XRE-family HTH domain